MGRLLGALGLTAMLLAAPAMAQQTLRLVADQWPPFSDQALPGGGLATSIVTTALSRAGYTSEFQEVPWARALRGIGDGRYDVLINTWYTEPRTHVGAYSVAYLINRVRLLSQQGRAISYAEHADLYPYRIAVVRDYAYSAQFDADPQLRKVAVGNFQSALRMLAAGRVDLAVEDEYVARFALQREPQQVREAVTFVERPLIENSLHILVSLKHPEHRQIVERFDHAIAAMKADGSFERLLKQFGF